MFSGLLDLIRLALLQATWNRRGMQELGWIWVASPHLRSIRGEEWVPRWIGFRNTNPYLAGLVVGAGIRMERQGESDRSIPLMDAMSHNLGAVGDACFWTGLRPAFALGGIALGLLWNWAAVPVVWMVFALCFAVGLRLWGFRTGLRLGSDVVGQFDRARMQAWLQRVRWLVFVTGVGASIGVLMRVEMSIATYATLAWGTICAWRRLPMEIALPALAIGLFIFTKS